MKVADGSSSSSDSSRGLPAASCKAQAPPSYSGPRPYLTPSAQHAADGAAANPLRTVSSSLAAQHGRSKPQPGLSTSDPNILVTPVTRRAAGLTTSDPNIPATPVTRRAAGGAASGPQKLSSPPTPLLLAVAVTDPVNAREGLCVQEQAGGSIGSDSSADANAAASPSAAQAQRKSFAAAVLLGRDADAAGSTPSATVSTAHDVATVSAAAASHLAELRHSHAATSTSSTSTPTASTPASTATPSSPSTFGAPVSSRLARAPSRSSVVASP